MPTIANIHIDKALTNVSQKIVNAGLISGEVWPTVPVAKDSDLYFEYDKAHLRVEDDNWAPKTKAKEVDWDVKTQSYKAERFALQEIIDDNERQNADTPISIESDTVENLTSRLQIRREKRLVDILKDANNYDSDANPTIAAGKKWDQYTSADSDPNSDIKTARQVIRKKIFVRPNTMILPYDVYEVVREHPKVQDRIKYTQIAIVTADLLARLWDIDRVLIAGGGENTAAEGATDNLAYIWPNNVWIGYVAPRASLRNPSWGYHIQSQNFRVDRWRDDERAGDVIRVSFKEAVKLVTKSAGYMIQSPLSA